MRRPRVGVVIACVLLTALVAWLVAAATRSQSTGPVDAELARLRAAGLPATCEEVYGVAAPAATDGDPSTRAVPAEATEGSRHTSDDENGVRDVEAALKWLEETHGKFGSWGVTGPWDLDATDPWEETATPAQLTALRDWLERARPFFDRADAGLAKPRFRFVPSFDADGLPKLDFVSTQSHLIQLLSARGLAAGRADDRLAAIASAARFAGRIEVNCLLTAMVSLTPRETAVRSARAAAEEGSLPAADLLGVLDAELAAPVLPLFARGARSEAAWLATAWLAARAGGAAYWRANRPAWERVTRSFERMFDASEQIDFDEMTADDVAALMRLWSDATTIDASSPESFRAALAQFEVRLAGDRTGTRAGLRSVGRRLLRVESSSRLARVALAAKAHRERTGAWPASLDELAPVLGGAVPTDPATDRPFEYTTDGPKVCLRAAGEPGDDDATLRERLLLWRFPK